MEKERQGLGEKGHKPQATNWWRRRSRREEGQTTGYESTEKEKWKG